LVVPSSRPRTCSILLGARPAQPCANHHRQQPHPRARPTARAAATTGTGGGATSSGSGGGGSNDGGERPSNGHRGKRLRGGLAKTPGLFEVQDVSPPPRSLGVYALPPNTHTQDVIELCCAEPAAARGDDGESDSDGRPASPGASPDGGGGGEDAAVRRYIVTALVLQFKLVAGRYKREHSRLEVQPMGRFLTNLQLESAFRAKPFKGSKGGGKQAGGGGGGGGGGKLGAGEDGDGSGDAGSGGKKGGGR
jgi:hypothetical protein